VDTASPAEEPHRRIGDRLEQAIEHRADVPGELARGERVLETEPATRGASLRRMIFWLVVSAVSLYLVAPSVVAALGSWRQIERLSPAWLAVMAALQAATLFCLWALQRLSLHGARWRPVIASQLAGNALAKIAPGGGAMGGALQYRMLVETGLPPAGVVSGLTAANLLTLAVVLALPVLAIPAILRGGVERDLVNAAVAGLVVFVLLFAVGVLLLSSERPLRWVGRTIQRIRNRLRRRAEPLRTLPDRLVTERARILGTLGPRWKRALAAALGRWGFDYGCLLAALRALDSVPRPGLVLLAFCTAQILAQIPLTPGGLGFVEAGLTATLTLAGVAAGTAVVATFAYRLFAYWLQLPLGLVGLALQPKSPPRGDDTRAGASDDPATQSRGAP
jgi:putative heme transporter